MGWDEFINYVPKPAPPPFNPVVEVWRGVTVSGPSGKVEFNVRCTVELCGHCTRITFDRCITILNGDTVSIGEAFAEEET